MALYDFVCDCGNQSVKMMLMKDRNNPVSCNKCGKIMQRLIGNPGLAFHGTGFYKTDYQKPKDLKKSAIKEKKAREEGKSGYTEI